MLRFYCGRVKWCSLLHRGPFSATLYDSPQHLLNEQAVNRMPIPLALVVTVADGLVLFPPSV